MKLVNIGGIYINPDMVRTVWCIKDRGVIIKFDDAHEVTYPPPMTLEYVVAQLGAVDIAVRDALLDIVGRKTL